jgi:hypothetical protein
VTAETLASIEHDVWSALMVACGALLWRLWRTGLRKQYPFFFLFLAVILVRDLVLVFLPRNTNSYGYTFWGTAPFLWLSYVGVLFELYALVLRRYTGLAKAARGMAILFLAIAVGFSLALALAQRGRSGPFPLLTLFGFIEQGVLVVMTISLGGFLVIFAQFPIELTRNLKRYCLGYSMYFLSKSVALVISMTGAGSVGPYASLAIVTDACVSILYLLIVLSPEGERSPDLSRRVIDATQREHLQQKLVEIDKLADRIIKGQRR